MEEFLKNWEIRRVGKDLITVVSKNGEGGFLANKNDDSIASAILYMVAKDIMELTA